MNNSFEEWITLLESEWSQPNGFLGKLRDGVFDVHEGEQFAKMIESIKLQSSAVVELRFVSLIWYIPLFISWQKERALKKGADSLDFEQFSNRIQALVEDILGVP